MALERKLSSGKFWFVDADELKQNVDEEEIPRSRTRQTLRVHEGICGVLELVILRTGQETRTRTRTEVEVPDGFDEPSS